MFTERIVGKKRLWWETFTRNEIHHWNYYIYALPLNKMYLIACIYVTINGVGGLVPCQNGPEMEIRWKMLFPFLRASNGFLKKGPLNLRASSKLCLGELEIAFGIFVFWYFFSEV